MQQSNEDVHMTEKNQQIKDYSSETENSDRDEKSDTAKNYEEKVQQARAERIAFLKSLKIEEAKADLKEATNAMKGEKKPYCKKTYERIPRSLRKSNDSVYYSEEALYSRMILETIESDRKNCNFLLTETASSYEEKVQQARAEGIAFLKSFKIEETAKNYEEKVQQVKADRIAIIRILKIEEEYNSKKNNRNGDKKSAVFNHVTKSFEKVKKAKSERISVKSAVGHQIRKTFKNCKGKLQQTRTRRIALKPTVGRQIREPAKKCKEKVQQTGTERIVLKLAVGHQIREPVKKYKKIVQQTGTERIVLKLAVGRQMREAKADLKEVANAMKREKKACRKKTFEKIPCSLQKSNNSVTYSKEAPYDGKIEGAIEAEKKIIPPELEFKDAIFEGLYANYVQDVDVCEPKSEPELVYDKSVLENLTLKESNVKITPERITSLALYPSSESIILAAGSKHGNLGIWNAVSESSPYGFKIHLDSITHLAFNPYNPIQLISSSLDGTLRCCDMKKHTFYEICNVADVASCANFDFLSPTTYLVAHSKGAVTLIDTRTEGYKYEKKHINKMIKCVNVHPVNKDIFLTGGSLGNICLWDLRNLQEQPVAEIISHERYVQFAYFSPVSGNFILSSSCDSICISDCSNLTDVKMKKDMKYKVVQDPLFTFKASWLPYSEETFSVGIKEIPRKIQIYNTDFNVLHSVMHGKIVCGLHINVFHPFKPFIVGNNVNGKIFVLTDLE